MLNSIEPPWYATRMPGGVTGKVREGLPMSMCAEHVQQLGGESPLFNLMEVKD